MDGKPVLLDRKGLEEAMGLKGFFGRCVSGVLSKILELDGLNKTYESVYELQGPEFSEGTMRTIGVTYEVLPQQLERLPKEGGFITVSNHHFGAVDGMILNSVIGSRRPDHKILTTFILGLIPNLKDWFISVDNFKKGGSKSMGGIREAFDHIHAGHPLSLFPAGEVATYQKKKDRTATTKVIEDKPWTDNMMKLIKKSGFPVYPIYFDGVNSPSFHRLGKIHERLRTVRLVHEMLNKTGQCIKVRIGAPISAEEIAEMDIATLKRYLRARTYALQAQCLEHPIAETTDTPAKPVAPHIAADLISKEIESIQDKLLLNAGDYNAYLVDASEAPNCMQQIYRLREETFRAIGEGTCLELDTDQYDQYYKHLILWNIPNQEIVGAYRLGFGSDIFKDHGGVKGFYTDTLFSFGEQAPAILRDSIELGRSFIIEKYQREVLPLKLLFAGITISTLHDPSSKYCVGPVSISNSIPDFYKSLIVRYITKVYPFPPGKDFGSPTHPFVPNYLSVDPDALIENVKDIDAFDRLLYTMSDCQYRLPVLLRKYINCGARIACFNVDPLFSNSLDGLIVHRLSSFPENTLKSFLRGAPEDLIEKVFNHFYNNEPTACN